MLTVRQYRCDDHEQVWQLHKLALAGTGAYVESGPWDADLHQIEEVYLHNGGEFLVGIEGSRIVAMGALKRSDDRRAEIKRMRVHPACQRRGYGQAILQQLEQRAGELGYTTVHLDTTLQQEAAQHFYLKYGYREVGRKPWRKFTVLFYEKDLKA